MLRGINVNHLASVIAVADAKGFRAAAERLHLTQSAVSMQIRSVEERLGVPLFHRTTRSVELTDDGRKLVVAVRRMRADLVHVIENLRAGAALTSGHIELACAPSVAASIIPKAIAAFSSRHPQIVVKIHDVDSTRVLEMVQRDQVDFGILSALGPKRGITHEPIAQDPFVVVAPATGHPLSTRAWVMAQDLASMRVLLNPPGSVLRDLIDRALRHHGVKVQPTHEAFSGLTLVAMVGEGLGITVLPRLSLNGVDTSKCRILPIRPAMHRKIVCAWATRRTPSMAVRTFLDHLAAPDSPETPRMARERAGKGEPSLTRLRTRRP